MRARPAQVQSLDRGTITAPARNGTHEQNLIESQLAVVEALVGRLERELPELDAEELGDGPSQAIVSIRPRRHILHVDFQPAICPLDFDIWRCRGSAVLRVIVGVLEVFERRRDAKRGIRRRAAEGECPASDDTMRLDVCDGACEFRVEIDRDRLQRRAWSGAGCDYGCRDVFAARVADDARGTAIAYDADDVT